MLQRVLSWGLALLVLGAMVLHAEATKPTLQEVKMALDGYEWELNEKELKALGPDLCRVLRSLIELDEVMPNYFRLRALEALRFCKDSETLAFYQKYLLKPNDPSRLRRGFYSLAYAYGDAEPGIVQHIALALQNHSNLSLRKLVSKHTSHLKPKEKSY